MDSDFFLRLLTGVLTGIIVALFTARYALRRFYNERWWDKKYELYVQLVEAVHFIKNHNSYHNDLVSLESSGHPLGDSIRLSEDEEIKVHIECEDAKKTLKKIADLSPLMLNEKCKTLIDNFFDQNLNLLFEYDRDEIQTEEAHYQSFVSADKLLTAVTLEALNELRIESKSTNLIRKIFVNSKELFKKLARKNKM